MSSPVGSGNNSPRPVSPVINLHPDEEPPFAGGSVPDLNIPKLQVVNTYLKQNPPTWEDWYYTRVANGINNGIEQFIARSVIDILTLSIFKIASVAIDCFWIKGEPEGSRVVLNETTALKFIAAQEAQAIRSAAHQEARAIIMEALRQAEAIESQSLEETKDIKKESVTEESQSPLDTKTNIEGQNSAEQ